MNTLPDTLRIPLQDALSIKRPSGSLTEAAFVARIAARFPQHLQAIDEAGNVHFKVGESRTLFAAHADTVHSEEGVNKYTQEGSTVKASGAPLGADDGAGIAILCHMMSHSVPGYYIISRSEEVGGIGAKYVADNFPYLLEQFDRSICFDRAGTEEIITVQSGQRCASKEFAEALSVEFEKQGMLYAESTRGVYTDNKEFAGILSENVNLGVGYDRQHGPNETLDLSHFGLLAIAAVQIDWESLPTSRIPKKEKYSGYGTYLPSANLEDSMSPVEQWGGMDGVTDYEDQIFELEDAVHLAIAGNTSYLQITLTAQLAEITGVTFNECAKFVYVNKLKPEILEELDWGQSFETLADQMLIIAAPEIM